MQVAWAAVLAGVLIGLSARGAGAAEVSDVRSRTPLTAGKYYRLLGGAAVGRGLRFNNPFRLSTQLGETPESLSLTATYLDLWVGATLGRPVALQHGAAIHGAIALDGIAQEVVTPAYLLFYQPARRWAFTGRAGAPIIIEPDANFGFELGAGGAVYLTAGWALTFELIGSVFFGAATLDSARTTIPVASLQAGAMFDYEVLP